MSRVLSDENSRENRRGHLEVEAVPIDVDEGGMCCYIQTDKIHNAVGRSGSFPMRGVERWQRWATIRTIASYFGLLI